MEGVLCGADRHQEWLLPWWWSRYEAYNAYPVTFCDFGMSREARQWCAKRGQVVDIPPAFPAPLDRAQVPVELRGQWEAIYGASLWQSRSAWFQKPFALLATPYTKTIWLDLDTEILASLEELFKSCQGHPIALMRERETDHLPLFHADVKYNSGVIVYMHSALLIRRWADGALRYCHQFWGDDPLLSYLIHQNLAIVHEISPLWNWRIKDGLNVDARIVHWMGEGGKAYIRQHGGLKPMLQEWLQR